MTDGNSVFFWLEMDVARSRFDACGDNAIDELDDRFACD
jgi:hypothetical protein